MKNVVLAGSLGIALFCLAAIARAQTVVANWLFDTNLPSSYTSSAGFTGTTPGTGFPVAPETGSGGVTGFHASSTSLWSGPSGNGSTRSLNVNGWAVGDYYQFQVSTLGAPNVGLAWDQTSSNTGPRDFVLQYSTNGTTFTTFGSPFSVLANAAPNPTWSPTTNHPEFALTADLSSVTAINNQPSVFFFDW